MHSPLRIGYLASPGSSGGWRPSNPFKPHFEIGTTGEHRLSAARRKERRFWRLVAANSRAGRPHGLLVGWWLWERLSQRLWPSLEVPGAPYGFLKLRIVRYHGQAIVLPCGSPVLSGAQVAQIHCDNQRLLNLQYSGGSLVAAGRADLRAIAQWIDRNQPDVVALYGYTVLHAGAARLGFHCHRPPFTARLRAERLFMNGLLAIYNRNGVERLRRGRTLTAEPAEIWMSRTELMRRYLPPVSIREANAKPLAEAGQEQDASVLGIALR